MALTILNEDDRIEKLVVTNTLPLTPEQMHPKIEVLSIGILLEDFIFNTHKGIIFYECLIK